MMLKTRSYSTYKGHSRFAKACFDHVKILHKNFPSNSCCDTAFFYTFQGIIEISLN